MLQINISTYYSLIINIPFTYQLRKVRSQLPEHNYNYNKKREGI